MDRGVDWRLVGHRPTNNKFIDDHHVSVGTGCDYADLPPIKGHLPRQRRIQNSTSPVRIAAPHKPFDADPRLIPRYVDRLVAESTSCSATLHSLKQKRSVVKPIVAGSDDATAWCRRGQAPRQPAGGAAIRVGVVGPTTHRRVPRRGGAVGASRPGVQLVAVRRHHRRPEHRLIRSPDDDVDDDDDLFGCTRFWQLVNLRLQFQVPHVDAGSANGRIWVPHIPARSASRSIQ